MKTASALLLILSLSALLAMHVAAPAEFRMPGVRKALQTMDGQAVQAPQSNNPAIIKIA